MWLWFREGRPLGYGIARAAILILYGIIPTFQTAHSVEVYAAYGGMFIVLSLLWGWAMDGMRPDRFDIMGGSTVPCGDVDDYVCAARLASVAILGTRVVNLVIRARLGDCAKSGDGPKYHLRESRLSRTSCVSLSHHRSNRRLCEVQRVR